MVTSEIACANLTQAEPDMKVEGKELIIDLIAQWFVHTHRFKKAVRT